MKKILTLALAVLMVMSLAVPAFAADAITDVMETTGSYNNSSNVDVLIEKEDATVYYVNVDWESFNFTYSYGGWNPQEHAYNVGEAASWDKQSAKIVVTNHSNAAISGTVKFSDVDKTSDTVITTQGVTATLDKAAFDCETGVGRTYGSADSETITLNINGAPTAQNGAETGFTVGTIVLTISGS